MNTARPAAPTITVVIATYEQPMSLGKLFDALAPQVEATDEVIIADDGSGPWIHEFVAGWRSRLRCPLLHVSHPRSGEHKSRIGNRAVAHATRDYLVFFDGDCVPHPRCLADHRALAERGWWVQAQRGCVRERHTARFAPDLRSRLACVLRGGFRDPIILRWPIARVRRLADWDDATGCNFAMWRADFVAVNGYDERFRGWGALDIELTMRLRHLGVRCKDISWQALVYHLDHPRQSRAAVPLSAQLLAETLRTRRVRTPHGLDGHGDITPPARH
ncbi:MAG: glycosyltransferase [Opitutaceae bacterium]|nr:glycosyltransferase [Opitutaceae bacterium]